MNTVAKRHDLVRLTRVKIAVLVRPHCRLEFGPRHLRHDGRTGYATRASGGRKGIIARQLAADSDGSARCDRSMTLSVRLAGRSAHDMSVMAAKLSVKTTCQDALLLAK